MPTTLTAENLKKVTQTELAALLGVSTVAMRHWVTTAQPDEIGPFPSPTNDGSKRIYNWNHVREWLCRYKAYTTYGKALAQASGSETSLDEAKRRKEFANAQLAELELAEAQKRLVPARDVELAWADQIIRLRSRLMALPSRMAVLVTDGMSAAERESLFDAEIRQILSELDNE